MSVVGAGSENVLLTDPQGSLRALNVLAAQCSIRALTRSLDDLLDQLRAEEDPTSRVEIRHALLTLRMLRELRTVA